jgi:uncharacterized membrane protein YesL
MDTEKKYIFDNPKNVQKVLYGLFGCLVLLLSIEGFYAIYGFVACAFLVLAAKYILRPLVKREEDYYD